MICLHQSEMTQKLEKVMSSFNIEQDIKDEIKSVMKENSNVESAFISFDTPSKLNQYAIENMGMVEPTEYILNNDQDAKTASMQYIPIIKTIEKLLNHEDVLSYVMNNHKSNDGVLRDICDVTNPIGHAVKKYKIGAFYMLLANLPPKYRSQLHVIQLVAMVEAIHLKTFGFKKVLQPLIQDLKVLENNGIIIHKPEGEISIQGSIIALSGDNLEPMLLGVLQKILLH
ncbi:unnamed protein product [Mytilus edulis]|uniref:Uncharacterized protein n=1 Tax=Mytilus edulis TaxID=6550 RepID=A0A8S3VFG4_MYTED|nr:unnamed protein product [Mytilus edulis]